MAEDLGRLPFGVAGVLGSKPALATCSTALRDNPVLPCSLKRRVCQAVACVGSVAVKCGRAGSSCHRFCMTAWTCLGAVARAGSV